MDTRAEVREFLTSRRARITPDRAGIPGGGNRRVAGLIYTAEPGSPSAERLQLLASWAKTATRPDQTLSGSES